MLLGGILRSFQEIVDGRLKIEDDDVACGFNSGLIWRF